MLDVEVVDLVRDMTAVTIQNKCCRLLDSVCLACPAPIVGVNV